MWMIEVSALSGVDRVTPEAVVVFPHHPGTLFPLSLRIKCGRKCVCRSDGAHRCVHR